MIAKSSPWIVGICVFKPILIKRMSVVSPGAPVVGVPVDESSAFTRKYCGLYSMVLVMPSGVP